MDEVPEFNWSAVARSAFEKKLADFKLLEKFAEKSTLTEEDALRMGREVGKALGKRLREASEK
ncbi:hypothetical protein HY993_02850 [Candidatus Micrarchaeota archaeon]|nr:hypothetical protein [Candidatus Micrarchaeota archaeon]